MNVNDRNALRATSTVRLWCRDGRQAHPRDGEAERGGGRELRADLGSDGVPLGARRTGAQRDTRGPLLRDLASDRGRSRSSGAVSSRGMGHRRSRPDQMASASSAKIVVSRCGEATSVASS